MSSLNQTPRARGMTFERARPISGTEFLAPHVVRLAGRLGPDVRVLDVGCGSGYWAAYFAGHGCVAVGIDPSPSGIDVARAAHQGARFEQMEVSEEMLTQLGGDPFDLIVSTEVVEHLNYPPAWATGCYNALRPGGRLIASTSYHGWLKERTNRPGGQSDFHHDALGVGGHIKFVSLAHEVSYSRLLGSPIFTSLALGACRMWALAVCGRLPYVWCSTIVAARRPQ